MSISRRWFLGSLAGGSVALLRGGSSFGERVDAPVRGFAYVASDAPSREGLHVFRVEGRRWRPVQFVASRAPSALALAPDGRTLYVTNRVERYLGLPAGSVESYSIHPGSGELALVSRRGLSLSATSPEHLAISPDGKQLAVAATGGGLYNVFPVAEDGSLLPVRAVRKEIGSGAHAVHQQTAHPRCVRFDARHRLLAADLGTDTVSVFRGCEDLLQVVSRAEAKPGAGPRSLVLDRSESLAVIAGGLGMSLSAHPYDAERGTLQQVATYMEGHGNADGRWTSLVAHPRRDLLLGSWTDDVTSGVVCWRVHPQIGSLQRVGELVRQAHVEALVALDAHQDTFLALDKRRGRVDELVCDADHGELAWGSALAHVPQPCAVVLRNA